MVQPRPAAVGEREVVDIALAVHPRGDDAAIRAVLFRVFRHAEAEQGVEIHCVLQLRREHVEVVEPLRMHAIIAAVESAAAAHASPS